MTDPIHSSVTFATAFVRLLDEPQFVLDVLLLAAEPEHREFGLDLIAMVEDYLRPPRRE